MFQKRAGERTSHVLMKAFLWALYLPGYPDIQVEVGVGLRYKPDVVALSDAGMPRFWGEAGSVGRQKLALLLKRFPDTHFAFAKWHQATDPMEKMVKNAISGRTRTAPVDILLFPGDSADRFITHAGHISVDLSQVLKHRFHADSA